MTMRQIVGSNIKNQASGGKWLTYEDIVNTVRVYIYFYGDDEVNFMKLRLDQMAEEQDGLVKARQLISNLEETHTKVR